MAAQSHQRIITMALRRHAAYGRPVMRRMGALDCLHDVTMYYALCFVHVEHSVCHEPISVLLNTYMYTYIYIYIYNIYMYVYMYIYIYIPL